MKKKYSVEEVAILINRIQLLTSYSFQEIAFKIGVSVAMISKWKNGNLPISEKNFLKLKALAEGKLESKSNESHPPPAPFDFNREIMQVLLSIPGRMDQLTKQIEMLQAENGKLQQSMTQLSCRVKENFERAEQAERVARSVEDRVNSK